MSLVWGITCQPNPSTIPSPMSWDFLVIYLNDEDMVLSGPLVDWSDLDWPVTGFTLKCI
jgi:hypothetical protein